MTASYFTEGNDIRTAAAPWLGTKRWLIRQKYPSIWRWHGNRTETNIGMFVCGNSLVTDERGITELGQVMTRNPVFGYSPAAWICPNAEKNDKRIFIKGSLPAGLRDFLWSIPPLVNKADLTVELATSGGCGDGPWDSKVILRGETDWKGIPGFPAAVGYVRNGWTGRGWKSVHNSPNAYEHSLANCSRDDGTVFRREMEDAMEEKSAGSGAAGCPPVLEELEENWRQPPANPDNKSVLEKIAVVTHWRPHTVRRHDDFTEMKGMFSEYEQENHGHWIAGGSPKAYYADIIWNYVLPGTWPGNIRHWNHDTMRARFDRNPATMTGFGCRESDGKTHRCLIFSAAHVICGNHMMLLYEAKAVPQGKPSRDGAAVNERQCTADDGRWNQQRMFPSRMWMNRECGRRNCITRKKIITKNSMLPYARKEGEREQRFLRGRNSVWTGKNHAESCNMDGRSRFPNIAEWWKAEWWKEKGKKADELKPWGIGDFPVTGMKDDSGCRLHLKELIDRLIWRRMTDETVKDDWYPGRR